MEKNERGRRETRQRQRGTERDKETKERERGRKTEKGESEIHR